MELTFVNQNRRDIRLLDIEIKIDPSIIVSKDTGQVLDSITAVVRHSGRTEGTPLKIDLGESHIIVQGSSVGIAGSRHKIPLILRRSSSHSYTKETVNIQVIVRFVLLDARHIEQQIEASAVVPFRS